MNRLPHWWTDDPEGDAIVAGIDVPRRFEIGTRLFGLLIIAAGVAASLYVDDGDDRVNLAILLTTGLPWIVGNCGHRPRSRPAYALLVLAPTAVMTVAGTVAGSFESDPRLPDDVTYGTAHQFVMFLVLCLMVDNFLAPRRAMVLVTAGAWLVALGRFAVARDVLSLGLWATALLFVTISGFAVRGGAILVSRARDTIAAQVAADDRRRIARDVHDVVAHTLAVMMLHVTAARMAVGRASPVEATEALEEAERQGRASLTDVRRIIRLLRTEGEGESLAGVQPDLGDLGGLVDGYRAAGFPVDLRVTGPTERATPATGLALYRVVQEALANAARHGDGGATVELRVAHRKVGVTVRNPCPAGGPPSATGVGEVPSGSGLLGMRERMAAVGGTVTAAQQASTWVVDAQAPLDDSNPNADLRSPTPGPDLASSPAIPPSAGLPVR